MWYFIIRASPTPDTEQAEDSGGAYVNCWINFLIEDGAEHLAKFYVEQAGWMPEVTTEVRWVEQEDYEDDPEHLQFFSEAETDGASFVFNSWDISDEYEEEVH